jgi:hypothetical protein
MELESPDERMDPLVVFKYTTGADFILQAVVAMGYNAPSHIRVSLEYCDLASGILFGEPFCDGKACEAAANNDSIEVFCRHSSMFIDKN